MPVIATGIEEHKIELKENLDCSTKQGRAKFAKHAAAIANTDGEIGYIAIGVVDARHRETESRQVCGFSVDDPDQLQRQMVDAITYFIDPPFEVLYRQEAHPETGVVLGIVIIPVSQYRPHVVKNDGESISTGQIWVRRGTQVALASRAEIINMLRSWLDDEKRSLQETYRGIDRDAVDFKRIAESACRRLYHTLPRKTRCLVVGRILADHGRHDLFEEWFGVE